MKNFNIKSILLGFGMGMVFTAFISMIYLAGAMPKMNEGDIIREAKKLGMVFESEINLGNEPQESTSTTPIATHTPAPARTPTAAPEISIEISPNDLPGAVADKLLDAGLIKDTDAFIKRMEEMGLETKIREGVYKFKKGTGADEIITTITRG